MPNITVADITNAVDTGYVDTLNFSISLDTVIGIAGNNTGDKGGGYNGQDTN